MSKKSILARSLHKWLALIVGVQALIWFISGAYMTIVPLNIIHGDHLEHSHQAPLNLQEIGKRPGMQKIEGLQRKYERFELSTLVDRPVIKLSTGKSTEMFDLQTGDLLTPITVQTAEAIAKSAYTGKAAIAGTDWITKAPQEVARRPVPMWAVRFDDLGKTTFYISPQTGEIMARRHQLWRIFDFVWMFHIMDYENRVDVHNNLLRAAIIAAMLMACSGIWLLLYSFNRRPAK